MHFHWPQITYLSILAASLLYAAHDHGKPKTGKNNFWVHAIAAGITITILSFGGFFSQH